MKPRSTLLFFSATILTLHGIAQTSSPTPGTLPQPYETKSVLNLSNVIGWENNSTPIAPKGFKVQRFGDTLKSPRWTYQLPNGDILVAEVKKEFKGLTKVVVAIGGKLKADSREENKNRITLLRDKDHDGKAEVQHIFLEGLNMPFGMVLVKNHLYVACTDAVWKFPYTEGDTRITATGEKILDLPGDGRHWTRNIIANKDGSKLYVSVGSSSNVAEDGIDKEVRRACIIEINPDGSGEQLYASGLRNPVGMAWQPGTNVLWTAVNERDELGDELVPDYMTSVKPGGFYGWPYSYYGKNIDPRIKEKEQRLDLVDKAIVPDVALGNHTASLGLSFYDKKAFPAKYLNGAVIGQHGSWNSSHPTGYKVVFVPFKNGKPQPYEDFLTGFMINPEKNEVHGRPVGVTVLSNGALLVADDAGDSLWLVSYENPK
jgi:glucose/arabinose dehydrogenase